VIRGQGKWELPRSLTVIYFSLCVTDPEDYNLFDYNDENEDTRLPTSLSCSIIHIFSDEWFLETMGENFLKARRGVCGVSSQILPLFSYVMDMSEL